MSVIDTPAIFVCVRVSLYLCVCLHAWVVRRQRCEWTQGCALADGSSETRNAIHSSARPHWEKEGGIRWVSEFLPFMPFLRRITFRVSLRGCTDLPFPVAPIIHSLPYATLSLPLLLDWMPCAVCDKTLSRRHSYIFTKPLLCPVISFNVVPSAQWDG